MNRPRVLVAMVKADLLERTRRYSFLLCMGFAVYMGYAVFAGQVSLRLDPYVGVMNSAWIGSEMGLVTTVWLSLIGFYVVKNSIQRDRETRVGQILATTPMSKWFYALAKALSNWVVLSAMLLILAVAAVLIQVLHGQGTHLDLVALLGPMLLFGLSALAVTGALAVLFESLPVLRGGVGNVAYFFLWTAMLSLGVAGIDARVARQAPPTVLACLRDYAGLGEISGQMQTQLYAMDPNFGGGTAFGVGGSKKTTKTFLWNGVKWSPAMLAGRALWFGIALGLAGLAGVFFDRFDPARGTARLPRRKRKQAVQVLAAEMGNIFGDSSRHSAARLTPLVRTGAQGRFFSLAWAEFKLLMCGYGWWWYVVAAGLFIACLASPLDESRSGVILAAWLWPTLLWSQMGSREARNSTQSLIFSARSSFPRQLLAVWVAGVMVAAITGGGLALRLAIAGDWAGLGGWATGALFIPAMALALGVWTESRKPFEALYTALWYIGALHHIPKLDFMGTTAISSTPWIYLVLALALVMAACGWRRARLALA